jgi:hypothetical protein
MCYFFVLPVMRSPVFHLESTIALIGQRFGYHARRLSLAGKV